MGTTLLVFLYTMALSYPLNPNDVSKKKYYDFIHNLPLFMPVSDIGNTFSQFLDHYPVTPYLDSREYDKMGSFYT